MVKNLSNQVPGSAPKSAHCRFHQILHKAQKCRLTPCNTGIGSASEISAGLGLEPLSDIASLKEALNDCRVSLEQQTQARAQAEARFSGDLADERLARQKEAEQFHSEINFAKMQIETARQAERELREQLKTERAQKYGELSSYRQRANSGADAGMVLRCTKLQGLLKEPGLRHPTNRLPFSLVLMDQRFPMSQTLRLWSAF